MRNYNEFKEELLRRKAEQKAIDRRKRRLIGSVCIILCLVIVASVVMRPTTKVQALNLMEGIKAQTVAGKEPDAAFRNAQYEFALALFKACREADGENAVVSPLSVMLALSMTANGAKGETLRQMEEVLGLRIPELNAYLKTYVNQLPSNKKSTVHIANSIWFREGLEVNRDFLQTNANYYGADAYASPFDAQTLKDINTWVSENTDGKIDKILEDFGSDMFMYLINAMYFDAKWERGFFDQSKTITSSFYRADGGKQIVTKMESTVEQYLRTINAVGFMKEYSGGKYKFVALLPNKNLTLDEFLADLTPETLTATLDNAETASVLTWLPEYTVDYRITLNDALSQIGMPAAFDPYSADFSGVIDTTVDGNIYIDKVIHKTHITVNAEGTKAAAATEVGLIKDGIGGGNCDYSVDLNRPFMYMIVDSENNLPLFIGTVDQVN